MGFLTLFLIFTSSFLILLTLNQNDALKIDKVREEFSFIEKLTMSVLFFQFFLYLLKLKTNEF